MKKVLVADDSAGGRELIRIVLEHAGHAVCEVSDGPDVVRRAREYEPDLIVLDLSMPSMDGFEVFQEIRRDERLAATPVVLLTASAMAGDRGRALTMGFNGFISKPIGLRELRREMERWLGPGREDTKRRELAQGCSA